MNTFIGFFKDTSLVLIIGIFDLLKSGITAVADPAWQGFGNEVYLTLAAIYFVLLLCHVEIQPRSRARAGPRASALKKEIAMSTARWSLRHLTRSMLPARRRSCWTR